MFLDDVIREKTVYCNEKKKRRSLIRGIERSENAVIAEIKRKSPSEGMIRDINVEDAAILMENGSACAISVLTDERFDGSLEDLKRARKAVKIPVLRKDFVVDGFQLSEALVYGADAVLLIVKILKERTKTFVEMAHQLGLETLVEVHDKEDLKFALNSDARLIGINNRNLNTFEISLEMTEKLLKLIPDDRLIISESGIKSVGDIKRLKNLGVDAFLIGTSIMKSDDIEKKVREFVG